MANPPTVALVCARPETIVADYARLLALSGAPAPGPGATTLLAAVGRRLPLPGSSSPPWQLHGAALALRAAGHAALSLRRSAPDPQDLHGLGSAARRLGVADGGPGGGPLALLATLRRGPATSMDGACGLLRGGERAALAVIDGTTVGNGPPGDAGRPEVGGVLIASLDPLAADVAAAALLGLGVADVPHLRAAHAAGRCPGGLGELRVGGDARAAEMRWPAHPGRGRRPAFASWPREERERYASWIYDTAWGRLFARYSLPPGHADALPA